MRNLLSSVVAALLALAMSPPLLRGQHLLSAPEEMVGPQQAFVQALVITGDLDGDGDLDLVRHDTGPGVLTLLMNDGSGRMVPGQVLPFPFNGLVHAVADFTGDLLPDLLVYFPDYAATGNALIVVRGMGGGSFGGPFVIQTPPFPKVIGVADANNDGRPDIGLMCRNPTGAIGVVLTWLLNLGGGGFALAPGVPYTGVGGGEIAILDHDDDGDADFAAAMAGSLQFYATGPGGAVTPAQAIPLPANPLWGVAAGRFDADTDTDLALVAHTPTAANPWGGDVFVLTNGGGGSWSLGPAQSFTFQGVASHASSGDFDGDGLDDLLVDGVTFLVNLGGTFALRGSLPWGASLSSRRPFADIDGDGLLDVVTKWAILYSGGDFAESFPQSFFFDVLRDHDGDGDLDGYESNGVDLNDGRGRFVTTVPLTLPQAPPVSNLGQPVAIHDFDGDQRIDMVVPSWDRTNPFLPVFNGMRFLRGDGLGGFTDAWEASPSPMSGYPQTRSCPLVLDLDGDGDRDFTSYEGFWINDGSGRFTLTPTTFYPWLPRIVGDVDGDGDLDFVATGSVGSSSGFALLRNNGGTFGVEFIAGGPYFIDRENRPALGDIDGDGDLDLVLDDSDNNATFNQSTVRVYENIGGTFSLALTVSLPEHGITTAGIADIDGDGLADVLLGSPLLGGRLTLLRRAGPGLVFDPPRAYWTSGFSVLADIDGDGDIDVVGRATTLNRRFRGAAGGFARQYGAGVPGSGGHTPILGATGPFRPGSPMTIRVANAMGGQAGFLLAGLTEASVPDFGAPGVTLYATNTIGIVPFVLSGSPNTPGRGGITFAVAPLSPSLAGLGLYLQAASGDPGGSLGITATNGLEIRIGL